MLNADEYIKNYKLPKEDKKIELSAAFTKRIAEDLKTADTDLENRLSELLEEQLKKHEQVIRKIRAEQYCEHEWHIFTKEELYKFGSPKAWKIEDWNKEDIEEFYMYRFGYCEKCKMPYKFKTFSDKDFERIIKEYESEDIITIKAYNTASNKLFDRLLDEKLSRVSRGK